MWLLFSLLCALSLSISDLLCKIALRDTDMYLVAWIKVFLPFLFLMPGIFFIPIPRIDHDFVMTCLLLFPLEITALLLYIKAIQVSPLSLTVPFQALTPIFLVFTSYKMLHEKVSFSGLLGILLIGIGSYMLNIDRITSGFFEPIRAIGNEKGSWMMIIVALIYSVTANLGKMAIRKTSPLFFAIVLNGIMSLLMLPFPFVFSRPPLKKLKAHALLFMGIGVAMAAMAFFHMLAIIRIEVAYMIAIKRTSLLFSVIFGCILLDEKHFGERFWASLVMFAGALLIAL